MGETGALPEAVYKEEFVIDRLLETSKQFRAFYKVERTKITGSVSWVHNPALPKGIDCRVTWLQSDEGIMSQAVHLRRIPARTEDALRIAHELGHLVLRSEGFPAIGYKLPQYETLSSAFNSMVHDPLVNSRLLAYGFDLRNDYETEAAQTIHQLKGLTKPPSNRLGRLHWMANYAGNILDWELLNLHGQKSELQKWFDSRYPSIADEAKKLLNMVRRIGYKTPEKQSRLFRNIVRHYRLDGVLIPP